MSRRTSRPAKRRLSLLLALLVGSVVLTGCDFNVYKLPLPGGTNVGSNPITVTADFTDVLDLVPKSTVKVNDVSVGEITDVQLNQDNFSAVVTMKLRNDTKLPDNTIATIRQTSLLGEKFVSLAAPTSGATGTLATGDVIPLDHTGQNPQVEEVLGALSLVLNGGGIAQLKTIATEINQTLAGREDSARSVLTQLGDLTGQLSNRRTDVVKAITSLDHLALSVKAQQGSIDSALAELPGALDSIDRQRGDLVTMLKSLDRLSSVGVRVIKRSKESTIESLRLLQPVLGQLANSGNALVDSISTALTFPFVDEVVGRDPQVARNLQAGDYTNLSAEIDVDLTDLPAVPGVPCTPLSQIPSGIPLNQILNLPNLCASAQAAITVCVNNPTVANCQNLPAGVLASVCGSLATPIPVLCSPAKSGVGNGGKGGGLGLPGVPGLPNLPGVGGGGGGLGGGGGGGGGGLGGLGGAIGGLGTSLTGNPRVAFAAGAPRGHGPTMGQLEHTYDPALVTLLTPGMVIR